MSTPSAPNESEAERRFSAERDRVERSPAQPDGPGRIEDDGRETPVDGAPPPHVKTERGPHMEH